MTANPKIKINLDSLKARREWKRHPVKDGHNVFRILPPFGAESNGYVFHKWQIIWGGEKSNQVVLDPETGRWRPFASSMMAEGKCPFTEFTQALKKKAEQMKAKAQASGESEEHIKDLLGPINQMIGYLGPKTVYVYNAVNKAGEVGLLELKSTAHKDMKTELDRYVNEVNQDPTSLNSDADDSGVWFDVIREGQGFKTEYSVKRCQNKIKNAAGKISYEDDQSPLPDSVVENYENLAYDLNSLYQVKTYEQLNEILQANMARIVELCPDADLSNLSAGDEFVVTDKKHLENARHFDGLITKGKVLSKDESNGLLHTEGQTRSGKTNTGYFKQEDVKKSTATAVVTDDFMDEADAILNS